MQIRYSPHPNDYPKLNTAELRAAFLIETLFTPDQVELVYTDADRAIVGSVVPASAPLKLVASAELRANYFCERRELGILNLGGAGSVVVDGENYDMAKLDCLYVGRGTEHLEFFSISQADRAAFFLLSYPAHATHPVKHARMQDAKKIELGDPKEANRRTIYQYIHTDGIKSCQLVMGFTQLHVGSVWNTMPAHTHTRRSEIYLYFDLAPKHRVMHFLGAPQQTRHLVVANRQAVISPSWSIHSGCGTGSYSFCWGMGGENQTFADMDPAPVETLR